MIWNRIDKETRKRYKLRKHIQVSCSTSSTVDETRTEKKEACESKHHNFPHKGNIFLLRTVVKICEGSIAKMERANERASRRTLWFPIQRKIAIHNVGGKGV